MDAEKQKLYPVPTTSQVSANAMSVQAWSKLDVDMGVGTSEPASFSKNVHVAQATITTTHPNTAV